MRYVEEQAERVRETFSPGGEVANASGDGGGDNAGDGVTVAGQGKRPPAPKHSHEED